MMLARRELVEKAASAPSSAAITYEDDNRWIDDMRGRMVRTHKGMTNWYGNRYGGMVAGTTWRLTGK